MFAVGFQLVAYVWWRVDLPRFLRLTMRFAFLGAALLLCAGIPSAAAADSNGEAFDAI
jgi:hypothetical protein